MILFEINITIEWFIIFIRYICTFIPVYDLILWTTKTISSKYNFMYNIYELIYTFGTKHMLLTT